MIPVMATNIIPTMTTTLLDGTLVQFFTRRNVGYMIAQASNFAQCDDGSVEADIACDDEPTHRAVQCTHWDAVPHDSAQGWYRAFRVDADEMLAALRRDLDAAVRARVEIALQSGPGTPEWFMAAGLVAPRTESRS